MEQLENSNVPKQLQPHVYKKGQSGNPNGRPKGSVSLKEYAKKMLQQMSSEEREEYLQGLPKQFIWEMAEGKADTKSDIASDGKPIHFVLNPELANKNNIKADESHPETN
jgi:hypothetical protein